MSKSTKADQVTVVAYLRASSDDQTASTTDQLKAIKEHVKRQGWKLLKTYTDEGKSGSKDIEKRVAFHQLIADSYRREFSLVVVYDSSRFGRLDSLNIATFASQLRTNGVALDCLGEGRIDWSTSMGRLQSALLAEGNHEYSQKLSRSTIRGRQQMLTERHAYPHGQLPYGYDRLYQGDGQTVAVKRSDPFRKPRNWTRTATINEQEAEVVRFVFDQWVNHNLSMRQIAIALDKRGVPGTGSGKGWKWSQVKAILTRKQYLGYGVIGRARKRKSAHNRADDLEVPGVLPAILPDDQLWHDAQRLLSENATEHRRPQTVNDHRALTGLLVCGHCGMRLEGKNRSNRKLGATFYQCSNGTQRSLTGCRQWAVYESEILPVVVREVVKAVDGAISSIVGAPTNDDTSTRQVLETEVGTLRDNLKRASGRLLTAPDEMLSDLQSAYDQLKKDCTAAEERLRLYKITDQGDGFESWRKWWDETIPKLIRLAPDGATEVTPLSLLIDEPHHGSEERPVVSLKDGAGLMTAGEFRALCRKLGVRVRCYWTKNKDRQGATDPAWLLDRAAIKVDFRWNDEHAADGDNSTGDHSGHVTRETVVRFPRPKRR